MSWSPPKTPNGIITQYTLYMNGTPIYSGNGTKYVVKGEFFARQHVRWVSHGCNAQMYD